MVMECQCFDAGLEETLCRFFVIVNRKCISVTMNTSSTIQEDKLAC